MRKNVTKLICCILALVMALSLVACGNSASNAPAANDAAAPAADPIVIKFCTTTAENQPSAHFGKTLKTALEEKSGGRIKVEVYSNSEMGKASELLEGLQLGTIEMTVSTSANLGGFTDAVALLDLPYLFSCGAAATEAMDGEIGDGILAELEASGFHGLGWVTGHEKLWRLLTANDEVRLPSQLNGRKLRVMNNAIHETTWNTLGASAIPMAFSEVYSSLQNGTIDAQENPWGQIQGSKFYEVQTHIIKTEHSYDFSPILISKVFWEGLSAEDQALIQETVDEIIPIERTYTDELQDMAEKEASDYGCTIVELTPEEKAEWMKLGRSIHSKFADKIGQERIDACLAISAKYE